MPEPFSSGFSGSDSLTWYKKGKNGDIIVYGGGCQVIVDIDMLEYIAGNLTKVNHLGVEVKTIPLEQLITVRGSGRMILDRIKGETKKGRIALIIKKYV
ncbi:YlmH/Sll1252 family protein [Phosphitispora sp. TUW77]